MRLDFGSVALRGLTIACAPLGHSFEGPNLDCRWYCFGLPARIPKLYALNFKAGTHGSIKAQHAASSCLQGLVPQPMERLQRSSEGVPYPGLTLVLLLGGLRSCGGAPRTALRLSPGVPGCQHPWLSLQACARRAGCSQCSGWHRATPLPPPRNPPASASVLDMAATGWPLGYAVG